jgi:CRISPR-associated endonuclease/helicase Cas3
VSPRENFCSDFELLTGHGPFPWQQKLFDEFLGKRFPEACDIPTGLGKTSVIAIWLLALARHAGAGTAAAFSRRLVYVVNRRTVVDQATREAEQMRQALVTKPELRAVAGVLRSLGIGLSDDPLAISTLRGRFADNADWRNDPARPTVVVGTVDMVGSRLLFAGYGCGFRRFPCLHVRLHWRDAQGRPVQVPGPVCFGSGRFYGLGLFAAL